MTTCPDHTVPAFGCLRCPSPLVHVEPPGMVVDALTTAERDQWKARAERAEESLIYLRANAQSWRDRCEARAKAAEDCVQALQDSTDDLIEEVHSLRAELHALLQAPGP